MFLCICILTNYFFLTFTQSFYIALSHISIRTRNKVSAGVLIIREPQADGSMRNIYKGASADGSAGAGGPKKTFEN